MKILLEESDITTIIEQHIKAANVLNLAEQPFTVELQIDGTEVTAAINTDVAAVANPEAEAKPAPKRRRRKQKSPEPVAEEAPEAEDEAEQEPEPAKEEPAAEETAEPETTEEAPQEEEKPKKSLFAGVKKSAVVEPEDEKPPFKADEQPNKKSLFA
ncbi:hypothetical protein [Alteromonas sp. RKMC-009]|uniref:hypothetical protein n=1 Tax=Alteromonas sp. RKMC-009 TaxID=2267264 RepID=UPI000E676A55|nr:hypothetical protein [Alteromonas sp. RKMC-009]AYA64337.1 hypothetical protein DS731_10185 [Alteromonas sp. RKMC-009]